MKQGKSEMSVLCNMQLNTKSDKYLNDDNVTKFVFFQQRYFHLNPLLNEYFISPTS